MRTKPIIFNFLFFFFTMVAISLPLQVAFLYEHQVFNLSEWSSIFLKLTPMNWMVLTLCLLNGWLCYQVHPFIKYTIPASILFVGVNNFIVGSYGVDYNFVATWIGTLLYALFSYSFVYAHGLEVVEHPERQWWKIPRRVRKTFPVWLEYKGEKKLLAKTFDISETGAYVSALANNKNLIPKDLEIGEALTILIGTTEGEIELEATLVRKENEAIGKYPVGLGLHFENLSLWKSLKVRRLLHTINA